MVDTLSYFSLQPVLHDWCNKGHDMCYPGCRIMRIKGTLAANWKEAHAAAAGFICLSEWPFTICLASLHNTVSSFLKCSIL